MSVRDKNNYLNAMFDATPTPETTSCKFGHDSKTRQVPMPILILPVPRCHQMITGHTMTAYSFAPERNQPHQCDLLMAYDIHRLPHRSGDQAQHMAYDIHRHELLIRIPTLGAPPLPKTMQNPVYIATAQDRQVYLRDSEDAITQIIKTTHMRL